MTPPCATLTCGFVNLLTNAAFVQVLPGAPANTHATPPATMGVDMEVPLIYTYELRLAGEAE